MSRATAAKEILAKLQDVYAIERQTPTSGRGDRSYRPFIDRVSLDEFYLVNISRATSQLHQEKRRPPGGPKRMSSRCGAQHAADRVLVLDQRYRPGPTGS